MTKRIFYRIILVSLLIVFLFLYVLKIDTNVKLGAYAIVTIFYPMCMISIWKVYFENKVKVKDEIEDELDFESIIKKYGLDDENKYLSEREIDVLRFEREWSERSNVLNNFKTKHNDFRNKNYYLFNSVKNLKISIQELSKLISFCKRCENRDYTIWELYKNSLIIRCDVCKKKSIIKNKVVPYIFNNYNYYFKLEEYCKATNKKLRLQLQRFDNIKINYRVGRRPNYRFDVDYIVWEKFPFKKREFKANTPLYRGLTFKGIGTKQLEESEGKDKKRSRRISQDVKDKVWNRDGGKCRECNSNENLEFDHIIPHSKGGANTYRNIQLLCESCNRSKSDKIG